MSVKKVIFDRLIKLLLYGQAVPRGLAELHEYFRLYGSINFRIEKGEDSIVAVSNNFRYGSIVTSGKNDAELEENIKDAILTSFSVPSSYAQEAKIHKVDGGSANAYAFA